ncbi:angiopoietin-4-like [Penaeus indicus]|uniref:angiopoietin-4-like n=1 Tax=Penaeus indicus TaxID=29960 RepID=UPI00300BFAB1
MAHMLETRLVDPSSYRTSSEDTDSGTSRGGSGGGGSSTSRADSLMDQRLHLLTEHVARIDNKLSTMQKALDTNSISAAPDELIAAASESYRVGVKVPREQILEKTPVLDQLQESMDSLRESVSSMDRRLQFHMAYVSGDLETLSGSVRDIHDAILEEQHPTTDATTVPPGSNTTRQSAPLNKIDSLVNKMSPMETVWEKMEEVWDVVVGTKSSVDVLVPKSEALLNTSQRQERAISTIQSDLTEKANRIIHNLGQVGEKFPASLQTYLMERNVTDAPTTTERTPVGPSGLVFPSVQKKPVILNTTFMINELNDQKKQGYSCGDLSKRGMVESGTYYLKIRGTTYWFLKVYCDMDTAGGGWTVIQRRDDYGEPRETFNREWDDYKHGFGNPEAEFWLGNENIYMLTNTDDYMLRVELEDFDGNRRYAEYSTFKLHSEQEMYKLEIGGYSGNAGDSLNDPWYGSNLSPFSTVNRDNDRSSLNCASMLKGGWWWRSCGRGLNGLYLTDPNDLSARQGIVWFRWRGWDYTLKKSVLMIRPKSHSKGNQQS